eukprot:TRINITY_DN869_c0_g1_i1.p1 TRINITY_DN869_c0_g1~~TRINITY_DN869_c0_g1_i1.p1  ORF type:complete len:173 (-),score=25.62 TRINITY_DN869_c0_g1_i1:18-536(-)
MFCNFKNRVSLSSVFCFGDCSFSSPIDCDSRGQLQQNYFEVKDVALSKKSRILKTPHKKGNIMLNPKRSTSKQHVLMVGSRKFASKVNSLIDTIDSDALSIIAISERQRVLDLKIQKQQMEQFADKYKNKCYLEKQHSFIFKLFNPVAVHHFIVSNPKRIVLDSSISDAEVK